MTLKDDRAPLLSCFKLCSSFNNHWWIQTGVTIQKRPIWVKIDVCLDVRPRNMTYDLENKANLRDLIVATSLVIPNWIQIVIFSARVTVKFDGWPRKTIGHFYITSSYVSFQIHWWIQTGFTVQKRSIRVEIGDMLSRVTLKFVRWPWKTNRALFYTLSNFVHHLVAIGEFKLGLQSGNAQSGSNSTIFRAVRSWNLTDDIAKQ